MESTVRPEPNIVIILGATGDLTWRKLIPAIYNLYLDKWIPDQFAVIGVSRTKLTEAAFHKRLHQGFALAARRSEDIEIRQRYGPINRHIEPAGAGFGDDILSEVQP